MGFKVKVKMKVKLLPTGFKPISITRMTTDLAWQQTLRVKDSGTCRTFWHRRWLRLLSSFYVLKNAWLTITVQQCFLCNLTVVASRAGTVTFRELRLKTTGFYFYWFTYCPKTDFSSEVHSHTIQVFISPFFTFLQYRLIPTMNSKTGLVGLYQSHFAIHKP